MVCLLVSFDCWWDVCEVTIYVFVCVSESVFVEWEVLSIDDVWVWKYDVVSVSDDVSAV